MASNTLTGTTGNDILNAPGSVSTEVSGLSGADTITLNLSDDIAQAGAGDDSILVSVDGSAKSTVYGGEGSDTVTLGTAVLTNSVYIRTDAGNDSINLAGGAGFTVNNGAFVAGNAGDDTITATAAITLVTAGGGQGADVVTFAAGGTSSNVRGGKGKDSLTLRGAFSGSTLSGNEGFDTIRATGLTGTTSILGGGKGGDSIAIGTAAVASVVGGYLNDSITGFGIFAGGAVFGDKLAETVGGSGTGASEDGADLISFTAGTIGGSSSIYGAGGADTIKLANSASSSALLVDGGKGADRIGSTTLYLSGLGGSTLAGGSGHDTIRVLDGASAMIFGGNGTDSIAVGNLTALDSSVNGGAGADSITLMAAGAAHSAVAQVITINGGTGADVITLGSYTAGGTTGSQISAAVVGNVVYESGDKIVLNATNAVAAGANWLGNTQLYVAANMAGANAVSAVDGMSQAGSVMVFTSGDDLVIGFTTIAGTTVNTMINVYGGASAVKTTATAANVTLNADNFGFTLGTSNNDLVITFT